MDRDSTLKFGWVSWSCVALMVVWPASVGLFWLSAHVEDIRAQFASAVPVAGLKTSTRLACLGISLPALFAGLYGLRKMQILIRLCGTNGFFSAETVACLRMIGAALVWGAALETLGNTLVTLILTLGNQPGQRLLAVHISDVALLAFIAGGLMFVIARAFVVGEAIADEQAAFI